MNVPLSVDLSWHRPQCSGGVDFSSRPMPTDVIETRSIYFLNPVRHVCDVARAISYPDYPECSCSLHVMHPFRKPLRSLWTTTCCEMPKRTMTSKPWYSDKCCILAPVAPPQHHSLLSTAVSKRTFVASLREHCFPLSSALGRPCGWSVLSGLRCVWMYGC